MNIRNTLKNVGSFVQYLFECSHSLLSLHIIPHCFLEHMTMPRHINLRNHRHASLCRISYKFTTLFLCVVAPRLAYIVLGNGQLGVSFNLETPSGVICQMPMKYIYLKTG